MKMEKLPSGSYRIRKTYNKKTYTVIVDHKPTQKEAIELMADAMQGVNVAAHSMTLKQAANHYIDLKRSVLSPSTIRAYVSIVNGLPETLAALRLSDITAVHIQTYISQLATSQSPKSVRNKHAFVNAVLATYYPELQLHTKLPQRIKVEPYIPSDEDIRRIIEYSHGSVYEIPIMLACLGLRRSEIAALTLNDLDGNRLTINKALVYDENQKLTLKTTKTTASTRTIIIPDELAALIREKGYILCRNPNSITEYLNHAQDALGIQRFSLHKLRHYFASKLSSMNVPEADIMAMGGWATANVMKTVYRHSLKESQAASMKKISDQMSDIFYPTDSDDIP